MDRADPVSVLLAPYDSGVTFRSGASAGPEAILDGVWKGLPGGHFCDQQGHRWLTTAKRVKVFTDWIPEKRFSELTSSLHEVVSRMAAESFPVVLGGDHSVTAGSFLGACRGRHRETLLIVFDAHLDCWQPETVHNHSSFLRYLIEDEGVPGDHIVVLGVRGLVPEHVLQSAHSLGVEVVGVQQIQRTGVADVLKEKIHERGDMPAYLSVDIDVLDPSHAPGTGTPEWGGIAPQDLFHSVEILATTGELLGFDLVEVAPRFDPSQRTQLLAAELLWRLLLLLNSEEAGIETT